MGPTFFRSLTGSFRALITRAAAEGMTDTFAILFCTLSLHVTRRPFHSLAVSFAMSSPICGYAGLNISCKLTKQQPIIKRTAAAQSELGVLSTTQNARQSEHANSSRIQGMLA